MLAHVGRASASLAGRWSRVAMIFLLLFVAVMDVESASLKKKSEGDSVMSIIPSTPPSSSPLPETTAGAPLSPNPPSLRSLQSALPAASISEAERKSLRRKSSGKKKSPNHALITRFGLSRWKEEEARRGAAMSETWMGDEASPRIPIKEKKGGGNKRRSSDEGESAMYYVRLPPSHHYYSPFLHGIPASEDQKLEVSSRDSSDHELEDEHVIRIEPLPVHHGHHSSHHSLHRHHAIRRLPLSFLSNGKPGPVYHWNLPIIRGEENEKRGWKKAYNNAKPLESSIHTTASTTPSSLYTSTTSSTRHPHIESDVFHVVKTVRGRVHPMAVPSVRSRVNGKRKPHHRKPLSSQPATSFPVSSYYSRKSDKSDVHGTRSKAQQAAMQKSFQGNGKPHGFYVINGSKKYYHRLLP